MNYVCYSCGNQFEGEPYMEILIGGGKTFFKVHSKECLEAIEEKFHVTQ